MNRRTVVTVLLAVLALGAAAYWVVRPLGLIVWRMGVVEKERVDVLSAETKRRALNVNVDRRNPILKVGNSTIAVDEGQVIRRDVEGQIEWSTKLPENFHLHELFQAGDLFVIQAREEPGGKDDAFVIDQNGQIRHRFSRQIVDVLPVGADQVFLTSKDVVRVTPDDEIVWSIAFDHEWIAGGRILTLESGDLVAFLYGRFNDSGVQVVRLDPSVGVEIWRQYCQPLGVVHSKYFHEAKGEIKANRLLVTSRGGETFVELLDLASGWQIERERRPN